MNVYITNLTQKVSEKIWQNQPDLTAIRTYFMRGLIRMNSYNVTRTNPYDLC